MGCVTQPIFQTSPCWSIFPGYSQLGFGLPAKSTPGYCHFRPGVTTSSGGGGHGNIECIAHLPFVTVHVQTVAPLPYLSDN